MYHASSLNKWLPIGKSRTENGVLAGTTDWLRREIVLDVPAEAISIHFGFYLRGGGTARARSFGLDKVGADVPSTTGGTRFNPGPTNLDMF